MSEDGQPDEAKEWEDYEGPQEIPDMYTEQNDVFKRKIEEYRAKRRRKNSSSTKKAK